MVKRMINIGVFNFIVIGWLLTTAAWSIPPGWNQPELSPSQMTVYGSCVLDGTILAEGDWVGAFDNNYCAAAGQVNSQGNYFLVVNGSAGTTPGFNQNETMMFRIYVVSTQTEYTNVETSGPGIPPTFEAGATKNINLNALPLPEPVIIAEFTGSPVNGNAPLQVVFTDQSTAIQTTITNWSWNFGDGETSAQQHPVHLFMSGGSYTVTLTVTDGSLVDTETKINYITVNNPPSTPANPNPTHQSANIDLNPTLAWSGGDPDGDAVTYDVFFGTSATPPQVSNNQAELTYLPGTLDHATTYYWKIEATDEHGAATASQVWSFSTIGNNPPNTPANPNPTHQSANIDLNPTLTWSGGDLDGDNVTYDVYFGTSTNPPLVSNDQTTLSYSPGMLNFATTYYWKIEATDEHGATTASQVWSFSTIGNNPPNTPANPNPTHQSANIDLNPTLTWSGGDPDGDNVTYDVYFGTSTNPPQVSNNQAELTYLPGTLDHATRYYWKIEGTDEHGASAEGPVWHFTTRVSDACDVNGDGAFNVLDTIQLILQNQ